MAYASRVYFIFKGISYYRIDILEDGFTGTRIRRNLGGDPILRRERNGDVFGSSLEFYAESEVDGEFSFLYTTNPISLKVQLWEISSPNDENPDDGTLLWEGFVVTEQYSEPFIDPPYDVTVVATDGLGELKYITYEPSQSDRYTENYTVLTALEFVLSKTGHTFPIFSNMVSIWDGHDTSIMNTPFRITGFEGQTYYDILTAILMLLHARIYLDMWAGELQWWLVRETEIARIIGPYINREYCTRMSSYGGYYPVGQLRLSIEPAKSGVTLISTDEVFKCIPRDSIQRFTTGSTYYARTTFKKFTFGTKKYSPLLTFNKTILSTVISNNTAYDKTVSYALRVDYNSTSYYYNGSTWVTTDTYLSLGTLSANAVSQSFEVELKAAMIPTAFGAVDVTVFITVSSSTTSNVKVEDISLALSNSDVILQIRSRRGDKVDTQAVYPYNLGRKDVLQLGNDARFPESDINLPIVLPVESTGAAINAAIAMGKLLGANFSSPANWVSANDSTGREYISLLARDYALSFAAPRRRLQGTLHSKNGGPQIFVVRFPDNNDYLIETYNWDLRTNDLEFSAMELPATSLALISEEISYTD